jgi:carbon-monoxide dehydrogenase small subunit
MRPQWLSEISGKESKAMPDQYRLVQVTVNGAKYQKHVEVRKLLSDFIREDLELTGTHVGCEHGICGACTVMLNGETTRSCLMFAVQANGASITTVEGLAGDGKLHPIQEAFWENHGLQCGFCTPGFLLTAVELLQRNPKPTEEEVREGISGNICRCTGYQHIIDSVMAASKKMGG